MRVLNRGVQWRHGEVRLGADPRHAELVVKECGTERGREAASSGDMEFFRKERREDEQALLTGAEATRFRATVARLNYMSRTSRPATLCERTRWIDVDAV